MRPGGVVLYGLYRDVPASGQGMVFVLSVLNREYNFERVFPHFNDRLGSSSCESRYDMRKIVLSTKFKTLAEAYSIPYLSDLD